MRKAWIYPCVAYVSSGAGATDCNFLTAAAQQQLIVALRMGAVLGWIGGRVGQARSVR